MRQQGEWVGEWVGQRNCQMGQQCEQQQAQIALGEIQGLRGLRGLGWDSEWATRWDTVR